MSHAAAIAQEGQQEEVVIFQGDASLIESALKVVPGRAIGTTQKFVFNGPGGEIFLKRSDIHSAEEQKHGFARKWVVATKQGATYQFLAENKAGLQNTMLALTGRIDASEAARQPELSLVNNRTAWLAAFGPTLAGIITFVILAIYNGGVNVVVNGYWSNWELFKVAILKFTFIYLFLRFDHVSLQRQGFNVDQLGIPKPHNIFAYLFQRAKAFGHGRGYAITWCVTFGIEIAIGLFG